MSAVMNFEFCELWGISRLAANQLATEEGLHHGVSKLVSKEVSGYDRH